MSEHLISLFFAGIVVAASSRMTRAAKSVIRRCRPIYSRVQRRRWPEYGSTAALAVVAMLAGIFASGCGGMMGSNFLNSSSNPYAYSSSRWHRNERSGELPRTEVVRASWYGPGFANRKTADGERFNPNALTAASRTLPLGSVVRVTNLKNGRSVDVRINDRGPYVRGRGLDLSRRAAQDIGMTRTGVAAVRVTPVAETYPTYHHYHHYYRRKRWRRPENTAYANVE